MIEVSYTSCCCNQTPNSLNWGKNNLIAFASCHSVRIYDPQYGSGGKILDTLTGHTKRVNCVKWICGEGVDFENELVSGSTDCDAIVWSARDGSYTSFVLKGHNSVVNLVGGLYKERDRKSAVVVTASVDFTLRVWLRRTVCDDFEQTQRIDLKDGLCMSLLLTAVPKTSSLLIACGMHNSTIILYSQNDETDEHQFSISKILEGHENWVQGLDVTIDANGDLILASSSQDTSIRLWRLSAIDNRKECDKNEDMYMKRFLRMGEANYEVSLESILAGHESWVYSVSWNSKDCTLLSASLDKSMIIWAYDEESGLWLEKVRVGEVGGNTLGFYGGKFGPSGDYILAHGYHGAIHIWNLSAEGNMWKPVVTVGGHFNEVTDLSWEPNGEFVISVSHDQTTRIHAPWQKNNKEITWHEIARPQVHGYDMNCLAVLSRYEFASGAEEKIVRAFKAPRNFVDNFQRICQVTDENGGIDAKYPQGAAVPSLGLSNKAVFENDNIEQAAAKSKKEPYPEESSFMAIELSEPPTEETLLQNTLWPEVQKLYGHGYEVYSLAATSDGSILASACKATTLEHASIILWDTANWNQIQKLQSHSLTVVQLAFSPDSNQLLSVSRDRRWTLFSKNPETSSFDIVATTDKKCGIHTRIIWCCAWSHDSKFFATGSRDGKAVVWTKFEDKPVENVLGQYGVASKNILDTKGECITALAFAPLKLPNYFIAVGFESGVIKLYQWNTEDWSLYSTLEREVAHHLSVKRLAFRPKLGVAGVEKRDLNKVLQLASCGSDHTVRIYNIDLCN